jgi:hypothetical protein
LTFPAYLDAMRLLVALACIALAAGCGQNDEQAAAPSLAELTVTVDEDGDGSAKATTTDVHCEAAGDSEACGAVATLKPDAFEPAPGTTACTQQYGGPETATVKGTLRGKPVDAKFSRENGCTIARWDAARALLEAAP